MTHPGSSSSRIQAVSLTGTSHHALGSSERHPAPINVGWRSSLLKIAGAGAAVGLALVVILVATTRDDVMWYKHVDEVVAAPSRWHGVRVQLHGQVVPGSVKRKPIRQVHEYRFFLEHNGASIEARYTGILPDTFKEGAEVVVRGKLTKGGFFNVDRGGIVAKCPSKYKVRSRTQTKGEQSLSPSPQ